jgi:predicted ester cyclase
MDLQEKKTLIEDVFEIFNRRALDELDGVFHPDYVDHTPTGDLHGVPEFKAYLETWLAAFPDARFEISNVIVEGDMAAWQAHMTGTHTGPLMAIPPTGRSVDVTGLHMGRLSPDGRPLEHWIGNEMLELMQQLGLVPDMAGAPAA